MMHIPEINLPELPCDVLQRASDALQLCSQNPIPEKNFPYPYIAPGGAYGTMWWQLDFSIALTGMRYLDYDFCRNGILNFVTAQKENGRIPLWGKDRLPEYNGERLQREEVSCLPKLFDAAWKIASSTGDREFIEQILDLTVKYLRWFQAARYDSRTGLFSAVFEETFIPHIGFAGEYAPVDLNTELLYGFLCTAKIARFCGKENLAEDLSRQAENLRQAIHDRLWNSQDKIFSGLMLHDDTFNTVRMASAFAALRCGIADEEQKQALLRLLTDPERFNWKNRPVSSVDMTDTAFAAITTQRYIGNPCWSGNVWTLINENTVRGLRDCGKNTLAAELAVETIKLFSNNFHEFYNPLTGDPGGVKKYAWSAGNCVDMLFSILFGIEFNAWENKIVIAPSFPQSWRGKSMTANNLHLPDGKTASIEVNCAETVKIKADIKMTDSCVKSYCGENTLQIYFV